MAWRRGQPPRRRHVVSPKDSIVERIADIYCKLLCALMAGGLMLMVALVFGNVVLRYVFNSGITVSEELGRWLFVWITFLGAIVALREHTHLGTDALVSRLPPAGKKTVSYTHLRAHETP